MTNFTNKIENATGVTISTETHNSLKEARKGARKLAKDFDMEKHAGHTINYKTGTELWTNY